MLWFDGDGGVAAQGSYNGVFKRFESVLTEFADQDFSTVLEERLKDFEDSDGFEDSLFFYPLTGGIFRLAQYISDNQF